jgi:cell division transport system permease protein
MSIFFSLNESLRSMSKARMATVLSVTSIALTLLLIGGFVLAGVNLHQWVSVMREKIELEVFLKVGAGAEQIGAVRGRLENMPGVAGLTYVSPEDAAKRFEQEFGENVYDVLAFNPFPASFIITLEESFRTPLKVETLKQSMESLDVIDEVVYQKPLIELIDHYLNLVYIGVLVICLIVIVIAVVLINNTIRLTIYARRDIIQIMRLVGATEGFIRRPFLIEGIFQGLAGSALAALLLYYTARLSATFLYPDIVYNWETFAALIGFGVLIGLLSAFFSVGKYLRRV